MIVTLDELKPVLAIPLSDTSQDDNLTRLLKAKITWVEGATRRRFDTPIPHIQIAPGTGEQEMYLEWHVDDVTPPPVPNPTTSVRVFRRPLLERFRDWEELIEGTDWERQGQTLLFLQAWSCWPPEDEIKVVYLGGYVAAPEDIKDVVLELALNEYFSGRRLSSPALTAETIGDFSYTLQNRLSPTNFVSDISAATIGRYKRMFC